MIDLASYRGQIGSFNAKVKYMKATRPVGNSNIPSTFYSPVHWTGILYVLLLLCTTLLLLSSSTLSLHSHTVQTYSLVLQRGHPTLKSITQRTQYSSFQESTLRSSHFNSSISTSSSQALKSKFWPSHKMQNKLVHIRTGNRSSKGIRLSHWNLGSSHLQNKMCEIEAAVARVKPSVLGISESNLHSYTDLSTVQIPGYRLLTAKTLQNPTVLMSRVVVYMSEEMSGKLREDLMNEDLSSIWIELSTPGRKKILVSNIYRDHQWMNQGVDKTSKGDEAVMQRWIVYLDQWQRALDTGAEVHCLGDFNIDSSKLNSHAGQHQPLVDKLLSKIVPLGVCQCAPGNIWTSQGAQRGSSSGLDHHWTNYPEKISEVSAITIGKSDHKLISSVRYAKVIQLVQKLVKKRSYKNFNEERFLAEVSVIRWWEFYQCPNVKVAVSVFIRLLMSILDREDMVPMKKFQSRMK